MPEQAPDENPSSKWNVTIILMDDERVYFEHIKKSQKDSIIRALKEEKGYHQHNSRGETWIVSDKVIWVKAEAVNNA